jgi:hypothetical protein
MMNKGDDVRVPGTTKKEELRKKAQGAFVQEKSAQHIDPRITEEEVRRKASTAKTTGLRELRLARDAAERK